MITQSRRARVAHQLRREWPRMKREMTPEGWLAYVVSLLVANRRGTATPERLRAGIDDPDTRRVALQLIAAASETADAAPQRSGEAR